MGTKLIKSKKYTGVYYSALDSGDLSYYITYKEYGKDKKVFLGKKSEGINEAFCHQKRNEAVNNLRFGNDTPIVKHKSKNTLSIDELLSKYLEHKTITKKTITSIKFSVETLKAVTQKLYIEDFTSEDIQKIKAHLKSNNKAPKTINNQLTMLTALFNFGIKQKLFKGENPLNNVDRLKTDNNRERYLNHSEVKQLKETIKHKPLLLLFVEVSLSTGARLETVCTISKKDINLNQKAITLSNHKSKNTYTGFISNSLYPLLMNRLKELKNPNDLIITTSAKTIQKQLQPILNKLFNGGLITKDTKNRVVIHTLRHTFASLLAINNEPIFTIMKLLDHKDIKDTLRYAKLAKDNGLEAITKLWS
ncbi:MAG: tyrosine-type recombinase/integrase [Campylobacteraceae bacterium]|nr:tyrosine-type recombinase/integrase [Campylobacteraceae bacterium]